MSVGSASEGNLIVKRNSRFIIIRTFAAMVFRNFTTNFFFFMKTTRNNVNIHYMWDRETIIIIVALSLYLISSSKTGWCRCGLFTICIHLKMDFISFHLKATILLMTLLQLNRKVKQRKQWKTIRTRQIFHHFEKIFVLFFIYHKVKFIISQ